MGEQYDVAIVGAGVIGCALARALSLRMPGERIVVLEKEARPGQHASGRNSGVIHSGFHLRPGGLRARLCVSGARRLKAYCRERGVPLREGGTLVVATEERGLMVLKELERRARANGVAVAFVEGRELKGLEPHVRGLAGLYAPEDAVLQPEAYVGALFEDSRAHGVRYLFGARLLSVKEHEGLLLETTRGPLRARLLVNCAGAHALHVARLAGLNPPYAVMPFRGEYYLLSKPYSFLVRSAIYPAPDLSYPFLGIHLTKRTDGQVLVGPNAVPSLGLEAYEWRAVRPGEAARLLKAQEVARLAWRPRNLSLLARELLSSLSRALFCARAKRLVPSLRPEMLARGPAGIRPQLLDRHGRLVDEPVLLTSSHSVHVLNAISPALTSSLSFADYLAALLLREGYIKASA